MFGVVGVAASAPPRQTVSRSTSPFAESNSDSNHTQREIAPDCSHACCTVPLFLFCLSLCCSGAPRRSLPHPIPFGLRTLPRKRKPSFDHRWWVDTSHTDNDTHAIASDMMRTQSALLFEGRPQRERRRWLVGGFVTCKESIRYKVKEI